MNVKAEEVVLEEEETIEPEIDNDELLGAIDNELADTNPEPEGEVDEKTDDFVEHEPASDKPDDKGKDLERTGEGEGAGDEDADTKDSGKPDAETSEEKRPDLTDGDRNKESKPSDEFGTLEDSVPEKTRERFETLKSRYDDVAKERDSIKAEANQWVTAIQNTGTNPEQFQMALDWLSKVNSGKPEDLNAAYEIMQGELEAVGKMLGKPLPGRYDPLDEHPDLKQKVDDGLLGEAEAQELIQARASQKLGKTNRDAQDAAASQQKMVTESLDAVKHYGEQLQASDPHFQAKMPYMEPIITAAVTSGVPPDKWLGMIKAAYEKLPNPAPVAHAAPKPTAPNPIRPTGATPSTGAMDKEPGSEIEALNQALERGW